MQHKTAHGPRTAGRVLHGARWYDLFGTVISFGRVRALREKLIELAAPAPGEHVLDVGCGTGTLAIAVKRRVGAGVVHGIDASPEMVQVAKQKSAKDGSDIDFRVALIEAIPFPDASFDLVTSSLMLHHLPDDLKAKGLREIRRVLKPGGRFMAMDFAAQSHSPFGCGRPLGHLRSILGHARGERMVDALTPLLRAAGFSAVEAIPTRHKNFAFIRAR
ncbi:MAG: methyltransferase domain-containing protein [Chloroflexota bacterium]|nr:methyltransferase domain-containing protein [Chloroflexota bacterium]